MIMKKVKIYFACHQHCEVFIIVSPKLSPVFEENKSVVISVAKSIGRKIT